MSETGKCLCWTFLTFPDKEMAVAQMAMIPGALSLGGSCIKGAGFGSARYANPPLTADETRRRHDTPLCSRSTTTPSPDKQR